MSRRLLGTILRQVAFLLAPEAPPLAHQLAALCVDLHLCVRSLWCVPLALLITWPVVLLGWRRTCRATCNWLVTGGGIGPLSLEGPLVVLSGVEVGLGEDAVLGAFLIHGEDVGLPFGIRPWDSEADVGDDAGVVAGGCLFAPLLLVPTGALGQ